MNNKDIKNILIAVNSTHSFGDKYPFGNKELTKTLKDLEEKKLIQFDKYTYFWKLNTKKEN